MQYNPAHSRSANTGKSKNLVYFSFLLILLLSGTAFAQQSFWPIDAPRALTSGFLEPRPGRYHMGVDFRSGGVIGKEVYAWGDGYVSRVRTTPSGYGKALYITLDDGKTVVYAHLSRFLPEIEEALFEQRVKNKSYDVDLWPSPGTFRVKKGQVVAWSGDTGSGAPHLHFEIRDSNNITLNPFAHGLVVRDNVPPTIGSILFKPLDRSAMINGLSSPYWHTSDSKTRPVLSGPVGVGVHVFDRIEPRGFNLSIYRLRVLVDSEEVFSKTYDRMSYDHNNFGALDFFRGERFGGRGYISAGFRRTGNELPIYSGDGILCGETLNISGPAVITIRAEDFAGNVSEASIPVVFGHTPVITSASFSPDGLLTFYGTHPRGRPMTAEIWREDTSGWAVERTISMERSVPGTFAAEIGTPGVFVYSRVYADMSGRGPGRYRIILKDDNGISSREYVLAYNPVRKAGIESPLSVSTSLDHDAVIVRVNSKTDLTSLPYLRVTRNGMEEPGETFLIPEGERDWIGWVGFPSGVSSLKLEAMGYDGSVRVGAEATKDFFTFHPNRAGSTTSADGRLTIEAGRGSFYRPSPVTIAPASVRPATELRPVPGSGYSINWGDEPLRGSVTVKLDGSTPFPDKTGIFVSSGKNWRLISSRMEENTLVGSMSGSGIIAAFTDNTPPSITPVSPAPGATIKNNRPLVRATISDRGSGIAGSSAIKMSIGKMEVYPEYHPDHSTVSYTHPRPLATGEHTVTLTVTDRLGSSRTRSWKFTVTQ